MIITRLVAENKGDLYRCEINSIPEQQRQARIRSTMANGYTENGTGNRLD